MCYAEILTDDKTDFMFYIYAPPFEYVFQVLTQLSVIYHIEKKQTQKSTVQNLICLTSDRMQEFIMLKYFETNHNLVQ